MKYLIFLILTSCSLFPPKPSNEIDELAEEVIKKREGIKITLEPIDENHKK
jgi:hypothetical protein